VAESFQQKFEPARFRDHVHIKRGQKGVARAPECSVAGRGQTLVFFLTHYANRIARSDFHAVVGGTVIDDEQFVRRARLFEDGRNRLRKIFGAVEAGNVGGDAHGRTGLRIR